MAGNDKLECMKELQEALRVKFDLEKQAEMMPVNLKKEEASLKEANEKYLELTERFNTVTEEVKSLSIRYEDAFQTRTTYEKQMEFLNTQREYEALSKQLDEAKVQEQSLLKQRNSKSQELDRLRGELDEQEKVCDEAKARVDAERAKVESSLDDVNRQLDEMNAKCEEIREGVIPDELYAKFANIVHKKNGEGIVPVHGQVCTGCDRVLPMQFVIDLRLKQQANEIEYCPYCSRIIWYEKLDDELEKNYIFEQLEPTKGEGKASQDEGSKSDSDSYDESMGEGFEDF